MRLNLQRICLTNVFLLCLFGAVGCQNGGSSYHHGFDGVEGGTWKTGVSGTQVMRTDEIFANQFGSSELFATHIYNFQMIDDSSGVFLAGHKEKSGSEPVNSLQRLDIVPSGRHQISDLLKAEKNPFAISPLVETSLVYASYESISNDQADVEIGILDLAKGEVVHKISLNQILPKSQESRQVLVFPSHPPVRLVLHSDLTVTLLVHTVDRMTHLITLSPDLKSVASQTILDRFDPTKIFFPSPFLLSDLGNGRVVVGLDLNLVEVQIVEKKLGIVLPGNGGNYFFTFDKNLNHQSVFMLDRSMSVSSVNARDGKLLLGGHYLNTAFQGDGFVGLYEEASDPRRGFQLKWKKRLELCASPRSTFVQDVHLSKDQHIWVGGMFGFEQVATGSIVRPGKAFLKKMDLFGNVIASDELDGQRESRVTLLRSAPSGKVFFNTIFDAGITHDAPTHQYEKALLMEI